MMPAPRNNQKLIAVNHLKLLAKLENLSRFTVFGCEQARRQGFTAKRTQEIELVLEEALVNIIEYAYPVDQPGWLTLNIEKHTDDKIHLEIKDQGVSFNPLDRADPDLETDLMERPIGGLGIVLMKKLTDGISWHRGNDENCLTIIFAQRHA